MKTSQISMLQLPLGSPMRPILFSLATNFPCFSLIQILLLVEVSWTQGFSLLSGEFSLTVKLFWLQVRDRQGLRVNGVAPPDEPLESFKPSRSLKELGCVKNLIVVFSSSSCTMYIVNGCALL